MSDEMPSILEEQDDTIDPLGGLRPRQRRLAQLLAEGKTNADIQKELGYSASRISILQNLPALRAEIARLQDKIFEKGIDERLKEFNNQALDHVEFVLTDRTNRVKVSEKNEIAKWVIEMQKSKAPQVHDVGQNMLSVLLDRLDAKKTERKALPVASSRDIDTEVRPVAEEIVINTEEKPQEDALTLWVDDFCSESE